MLTCLVCKEGEMKPNQGYDNWYSCSNCHTDSDNVMDNFAYPMFRRGTLCSIYTPAMNLDVEWFAVDQVIQFSTIRHKVKKAKVLHIDIRGNKMIMEDVVGKKIRFVVDNKVIEDAYDALFSVNKVAYAGWWNRRITLKRR